MEEGKVVSCREQEALDFLLPIPIEPQQSECPMP